MMEKLKTQKTVLCEYSFWKNIGKEAPTGELQTALDFEIYCNDIETTPDQIERNLRIKLDPEVKAKYTKPHMHFCQGHLDDYMGYFDEIYYDTVSHFIKNGGMIQYTMSGKAIYIEEDVDLQKNCMYCSEPAIHRITIYGSLEIFSHFHDTEIVEFDLPKKPSRKFKLESGRNWRILSNGWGKDSVYELIHNWDFYDEIIFSDTGSEQPETLEYIKTMMKKLPLGARLRITNLDAKDNPLGNLYDYYFAKKAMPTPMLRDCTGKFKINPIRRYLRDRYEEDAYFDMNVCINYTEAGERMIIRKDLEGLKSFLTYPETTNQVAKAVQKQMKKHNITVDEYLVKLAKRHNLSFEELIYRKVNEVQSGVQYMEIKYPLYDKKIHRKDEDEAIKSKGYEVPTKSGCFMCPYGTQAYYMKLENNHPDLHAKTIALIENSRMRKDVTQAKKGKLNLEEYQKDNGCGCFKGTFEEYSDDDMKRTNKW